MTWWWWRRERDREVAAARRAADLAGQRLAAAKRNDPVVHAESARIVRVSAENNLVPVILRALRGSQ